MQHPEHLHAGGELLIMPSYQVEIPRTTPQLYITGIYALNVQCPEGTTGDQHDVFHWFYRPGIREEAPTVTLGGSDELDTNAIYGDLGVYEGRERLLAKGLNIAPEIREVYVANHYLRPRLQPDRRHRRLARHPRAAPLRSGAGHAHGAVRGRGVPDPAGTVGEEGSSRHPVPDAVTPDAQRSAHSGSGPEARRPPLFG